MACLHWALQLLVVFFVTGWLLCGCVVLVDGVRWGLRRGWGDVAAVAAMGLGATLIFAALFLAIGSAMGICISGIEHGFAPLLCG